MIESVNWDEVMEKRRIERENSPEFKLIRDMGNDLLINLVGRNNRLDKRIEQYGGYAVQSACSQLHSSQWNHSHSSRPLREFFDGQLTLLESELRDETVRAVAASADAVGNHISHELRYSGRFRLGDEFQYKENLRLSSGEKISMYKFIGSWAVNYADSFANAVVLLNAGHDLVDVNNIGEALK